MTAHACPDCRCWTPDDDNPTQPSTASRWAIEAALKAAADGVRAAKERGGR